MGKSCGTLWLLAALSSATLFPGCGGEDEKKHNPPAMPVEFVTPAFGEKTVSHRLIGVVKPYKSVKLVARVSGFLLRREFQEGSLVKAGDTLFLIEPDQYRFALDQAAARLVAARSQQLSSQLEFDRVRQLFAENIASRKRFDDARAAIDSAKAGAAAAEAAFRQAELEFSYTRITAPFDGWVGLAAVDEGNFISAPSAPLAELNSIDMVRVEFSLSDAWLAGKFLDDVACGKAPEWEVSLTLQDGTPYPASGRVDCWENAISRSTATLTMQSFIDNGGHRLLPGLFVKVDLRDPHPRSVLLIDRRAIRLEQGVPTVMVIDAGNRLRMRPVVTGAQVGESVELVSGPSPGEKVALPGNPLLLPGAEVVPVPAGNGVEHGSE